MKIGLLFIIGIFGVSFFQHGCGNANKTNQSSANNQNLIVASASPTPSPTATPSPNQNTANNGISAEEAKKNREAEEKAEQEIKEFCKNMPVAQIEATPPFSDQKTRFVPFTIILDGSKSYDPNGKKIVKWEWSFGDGQTGKGKVITHTYNKAGLFAVSLVVTNSDGESKYVCSAYSQNILVVDRNQ